MTTPILPTAPELLRPALEKFYEQRPNSFKHINLSTGVYSYIFEGWKAQANLELKRVAQLIKNNRRGSAEGKELAEYLASEFHEEVILEPTAGIGQVTFNRVTATAGKGIIPKGTRLHRTGSGLPPFNTKTTDYELVDDVIFGPLSVFAIGRLKSTSNGSISSEPVTTPYVSNILGIGSVLFDSTITANDFDMSGGSDGVDDPYMRLLAKYSAIGKWGPTNSAAILGALRISGIRHEVGILDSSAGTLNLFVADSAWASSLNHCNQVKQYLYDKELIGFGCKVNVLQIVNKIITVDLNVTVRDRKYLDDPQSISDNIRKSVKSYFDDREDWYIWKNSGIRSSAIKSDRKILNCTSVTVRDNSGVAVTEPTPSDFSFVSFGTTYGIHHYLPLTAINITYSGPS